MYFESIKVVFCVNVDGVSLFLMSVTEGGKNGKMVTGLRAVIALWKRGGCSTGLLQRYILIFFVKIFIKSLCRH